MIYELRIYTLPPGAQAEYVRIATEVGRKARGDRYGKFEGGWTSEFGTLNQYYHLWSYDSLDERQRLRGQLAKEAGWQDYLQQIKRLVVKQENKILVPVDGVPFTPPSGGRHVYELRTYTAHYQQLPDWLGEFTGILPTRQQYSKIVGLWTTDVGPLNQAIHMWAYDDLNQRAEVRATVLKDPRWQEFLPRSTPLLAEMQSVILIPVPSSPLQ